MLENKQVRRIKSRFASECLLSWHLFFRSMHKSYQPRPSAKNSKKVWNGIKQIIRFKPPTSHRTIKITTNNNDITDRHMIADMFNIFFANIGKDLACSIPNVDMSPLEYLKTPLCNSFFISPTTAEEIESEITKVKSSKATGPFSIPVTILKILENCCIQASRGFVQCLLWDWYSQCPNVIPVYKT